MEGNRAKDPGSMESRVKNKVYLLRHGATEWSANGRHTSVTDLPLTEAGLAEAKRLPGMLAGLKFALVLSSPLARAVETCKLAGLERQMAIDADLHEWRYGAYEGLTTTQIHQSDPNWDVFIGPNPKGESAEDVTVRVDRVIAKARATDDDVALFAHGHILRALTARWLALPAEQARHFVLHTGTISVLGYEHSWPALVHWNAKGL